MGNILSHNVVCPYCSRMAESVPAARVWQWTTPSDERKLWVCFPCEAWVGVHKNSRKNAPMGRLANKALRQAKTAAHRAFDPIWKKGEMTRSEAYEWLAAEMGIVKVKNCHIGMFDDEQCAQVIAICAAYNERQKGENNGEKSKMPEVL